ncbi:GNAT family N-acetyltransferase [cf. Phormidesmis sp. LEGE 11477]|uniref:GNAT family N-acetyltransferase n=1 Tax=cf. Phormidesmis sp. LEGE 11477 TaxID=1828680 RepID=UPI00187F6892|nr:GNAT family N-acetyltransferase [cf. Phormidesmis sp. LEGE 11477]MBE9064924.1 GNAT family N-acetyltransferase [cf. Phormidesmis sp. LEGE 11477]
MLNIAIRPASTEDVDTLWTMLMYAAHESSLIAVQTNSDIARYVTGWGRKGDLGVIAEQGATAVGAAWVRLWSEDNRGYGYIADNIPELAIAVAPEVRGRGIGTALLTKILELVQPEFSAICLSTRTDNPALRLYERTGFVRVEGSEVMNRTGGGSLTMLCSFKR